MNIELHDAIDPRTADADAISHAERIDVEAVNRGDRRSPYKQREQIYPKRVRGTFRRLKWLVMAVTLTIYYVVPWLRWDRGPGAPDQAVLVDLPGRRFYFFFIELWPQEVYYFTGLLVLAAVSLFLLTALAGRVWCGYTCPQTVWTDLFMSVERFFEGDRASRIRLDRASWSARKLAKKSAKHVVWVLIGIGTGGAWVFYFADAPTLASALVSFEAPSVAYISIAVLTFTTYLFGGHAREQVCIYMCPWPRIQGAMLDENSLAVTYRADRGEPRGPFRKGDSWEARGHCVDCNQCVAACPMGIDIRDGLQLECISCALCIDACDRVMGRFGLPRGLIAYDTDAALASRSAGRSYRYRLLRPRTMLYGAIIAVVGLIMLYALVTRVDLDVTVQRDRNPLFTTLSDGSIQNGFTVKVLNMSWRERHFELALDGVSTEEIRLVGVNEGVESDHRFVVRPDSLRELRVVVTAAGPEAHAASTPVVFRVADLDTGTTAEHESFFVGPGR